MLFMAYKREIATFPPKYSRRKNGALIEISMEMLNMFVPYDIVIETEGGVT